MKRKNVLILVIVLIVAAAVAILWVPNIAIDANTPELLEDVILGTTAFRDAFNSTTIIVIGLILTGGFLFYQHSKDKQNKQYLGFALVAVLAFGAYLLLAPGLAAAFSDQDWLVSFADLAVDVNEFIDVNSGFLTFAALASLLAFIGYRSTK